MTLSEEAITKLEETVRKLHTRICKLESRVGINSPQQTQVKTNEPTAASK